jgi:BRCT domain type II-containing protein
MAMGETAGQVKKEKIKNQKAKIKNIEDKKLKILLTQVSLRP